VANLARTREIIERGLADGLHLGAQIFASRAGETVADLAMGENRPGVAMARDSLVLWMSSTKPVVAAAVLQLVERGQLQLDEPVSRWIPEFAAGGKQAITIRQVLTHTGGFRLIDLGWPDSSWAEIIDRICQTKLDRNWTPGERAGYHPQTGWYILAELVCRADGRLLSQFARTEIFEPLGMLDCWIGMPRDRYFEYGDRIGILTDTSRANHPSQRYSSEQGATDCIPGAGGLGPMRQLAMFYEMLLGGGQRQGVRILKPETVRLMTTRQRVVPILGGNSRLDVTSMARRASRNIKRAYVRCLMRCTKISG
jgi:CubicO group peptidase (beta-lactamase class C family)